MKPSPRPINVDGIPAALKRERRWSVWRYLLDNGRWIKKPLGKSNDPSTWLTFEHALAMYQRGGWDGLVFALGDGWGGADLDDCLFSGGVLMRQAQALIDAFEGCYCETSPSQAGCKLFFRSARVGFQADFSRVIPAFTRWQSPRFFTVTGQSAGDPTINGDQGLSRVLPPEAEPEYTGPREGYPDAAVTTDDDLLILMIGNDINGDDVLALWRGDTSGYGDDHSRADMALLRHLAFWTNYDAARVERLFRQSGLMRSHWDRSASYRRVSLTKALR